MKYLGAVLAVCGMVLGLPACETLDDRGYEVAVRKGGDPGRYEGHGSRSAGPPPHAPAHGYRHKHERHGVELVYDRHVDAYAVVGYEDHYYHDGYYFRYRNGDWEVSVDIGDSGRWSGAGAYSVPRKLKREYSGSRGKGHEGRGKGKGKGKRFSQAPSLSGPDWRLERFGKF